MQSQLGRRESSESDYSIALPVGYWELNEREIDWRRCMTRLLRLHCNFSLEGEIAKMEWTRFESSI